MTTHSPIRATHGPARIPERSNVTFEVFQQDILPAAKPVLMRGLVADWPLVQRGLASPRAFCDGLRRFDRGLTVPIMLGPPSIKGRFSYNADLSGFNFQNSTAKLGSVLDFVLEHLDDETPSSMAAQSIPVAQNLTGLQLENRMPLLDPGVDPRIWIGNRATVAAHYDPSENIACVVAGRRRFTLFPPDQAANLYVGPLELTPAGAAISMVDFEAPDFERFPRFADALAHAQVAEMEPGDALYIPYLWWHHVRAMEPFNALVNYWWAPPGAGAGAPRDALLHALLAIKELPAPHRAAWRAMFDHYVFQTGGPPAEHLPPERRGILGRLEPNMIRSVCTGLARVLQSR